ncbi:MAG: hypothetical protein AAGF33_19265 [Pseudomonadota bacterium]
MEVPARSAFHREQRHAYITSGCAVGVSSGLILAHQHLSQIDQDLRDAIIGNVGNLIVFRVGAHDAPFFERLMPVFTALDFQNQPNHRANVLLTHRGERLKSFTASMYPPYHRAA